MARPNTITVLDLGPDDPALRTDEQNARRRYTDTGDGQHVAPLLYQAPGLKRDALLLDPTALDSFLHTYAETGDFNGACTEHDLSPLLVRLRIKQDSVFAELVEYARQHITASMEAHIFQKGLGGDNACAFKHIEANDPRYGDKRIKVDQNVRSFNVEARADLPEKARERIREAARDALVDDDVS